MKKDGGPAFPTDQHFGTASKGFNGMSMRAYFAGQAMQGMLVNGFIPDQARPGRGQFDYAAAACKMADALIAELERE